MIGSLKFYNSYRLKKVGSIFLTTSILLMISPFNNSVNLSKSEKTIPSSNVESKEINLQQENNTFYTYYEEPTSLVITRKKKAPNFN